MKNKIIIVTFIFILNIFIVCGQVLDSFDKLDDYNMIVSSNIKINSSDVLVAYDKGIVTSWDNIKDSKEWGTSPLKLDSSTGWYVQECSNGCVKFNNIICDNSFESYELSLMHTERTYNDCIYYPDKIVKDLNIVSFNKWETNYIINFSGSYDPTFQVFSMNLSRGVFNNTFYNVSSNVTQINLTVGENGTWKTEVEMFNETGYNQANCTGVFVLNGASTPQCKVRTTSLVNITDLRLWFGFEANDIIDGTFQQDYSENNYNSELINIDNRVILINQSRNQKGLYLPSATSGNDNAELFLSRTYEELGVSNNRTSKTWVFYINVSSVSTDNYILLDSNGASQFRLSSDRVGITSSDCQWFQDGFDTLSGIEIIIWGWNNTGQCFIYDAIDGVYLKQGSTDESGTTLGLDLCLWDRCSRTQSSVSRSQNLTFYEILLFNRTLSVNDMLDLNTTLLNSSGWTDYSNLVTMINNNPVNITIINDTQFIQAETVLYSVVSESPTTNTLSAFNLTAYYHEEGGAPPPSLLCTNGTACTIDCSANPSITDEFNIDDLMLDGSGNVIFERDITFGKVIVDYDCKIIGNFNNKLMGGLT